MVLINKINKNLKFLEISQYNKNMKKLVLTITAGDFYNKLATLTHPLLKDYAKRCDADFLVLSEEKKYKYPHYLKCEIRELLKKYDRVLYIDTDIIVRPDSPSLFDIVPEDSFGIFEEGRFTERVVGFKEYLRLKRVNPDNWKHQYYNTGVFICSKRHERVFRLPETFDCHFYEQSYLNMNLLLDGVKIFQLPYVYNRMTCLDKPTGTHRLSSYFVHYAGLNIALPTDQYFATIERDIQEWKKGNYYSGYYIMVIVGGGIGDRISAEPAVRYICENLYKDDNVVVVCENPELYSHIKRPVYAPGDQIPNNDWYYRVYTLHPTMEDSPIYYYISPMLIHMCDLASLSIAKMTIPMSEKTIKLNVDKKALNSVFEKANKKDFSNCVLVHPGKSWPSKTLPEDVWQSYIDTIIDKCKKEVVLIGHDMANDFRKVLKVDGSRCIDLRNKLSISELVAVVSLCPILLSNDSAPIHIAGAFDNWIGLIATCKHPDYILPHRHSNIYYKAKNLEKRAIYYDYERRQTFVDGSRVDLCKEERLRECVPDPRAIEIFINDCFCLKNG